MEMMICSWYRSEYRYLKLVGATMRRGGVKKTGKDESIGVVIHICMETT
jgi:hypothetical protein